MELEFAKLDCRICGHFRSARADFSLMVDCVDGNR
jgi:hypothetical protein